MAISPQKVPKNGWMYYQESTKTNIIAMTWDDLVKSVTNHRKNNGIPIGDVEEDVNNQIEKKHPELSI